MMNAKKTRVSQPMFGTTGTLKNGRYNERACTSMSGFVRKTAATMPASASWKTNFSRPLIPPECFFVTLR